MWLSLTLNLALIGSRLHVCGLLVPREAFKGVVWAKAAKAYRLVTPDHDPAVREATQTRTVSPLLFTLSLTLLGFAAVLHLTSPWQDISFPHLTYAPLSVRHILDIIPRSIPDT